MEMILTPNMTLYSLFVHIDNPSVVTIEKIENYQISFGIFPIQHHNSNNKQRAFAILLIAHITSAIGVKLYQIGSTLTFSL